MQVIVALMVVAIAGVYAAENCMRPCPMDYSPVCATYTKTYSNECEMKADACEMAKKGFSLLGQPTQQICSCLRACPRIYSPICANDGNTYVNDCEMGSESCKQGKFLEKVTDGPCTSTTD